MFLGSPAAAFALNALTFGLSALAVLAIRDRGVFATRRPAPSPAAERPAGLFSPSLFNDLFGELAQGAAALRAHPEAVRLIGADIMCSFLYGTQTVLLLLVSRHVGLGAQGYGYMFAAIGAGGLIGTALTSRASRSSRPHRVQAAALAAAGLPTVLLTVTRLPAAAIVLAGLTGIGTLLVEILTETTLQRTLDEDVFGRAYGLALPASLGGIVVGSAIAPVLASLLGGSGALLAVGGAVLAYALLVLRGGTVRAAAAVLPRPSDETVMLPVPWDPYVRMARPSDATVVMPRPAVADAVPAR
jgi:hypothetical protein